MRLPWALTTLFSGMAKAESPQDQAVERSVQAARSAGGHVEFKAYRLHAAHGHLLFQHGASLWSGDVVRFLVRQGAISP